MPDRPLYDRAAFWLQLGAATATIGGIFVAIGIAQTVTKPDGNLWANPWFDRGLAVVVVCAGMLVWALVLYVADEQIERRTQGVEPAPVMPAVPPAPHAQAVPASPTHLARPLGMSLHPQSDIDIDVVRHQWMEIGGKQSLIADVRIHNTSATWPRAIKRHRWEFASGVPSVYQDDLVVEMKGSSLTVGPLDPSQTIEGMISCHISAEQPQPAFELYIEDDLGRESKASQ